MPSGFLMGSDDDLERNPIIRLDSRRRQSINETDKIPVLQNERKRE